MARSSDQTAKQIDAAFKRVDTTIRGLLGASIGAFFVKQFTDVTNELDNLAKSAQSVGVTTEALSSLRYAASYAGVEAEQLDRAMAKLAGRVSDVAKGNKEAAEVFDRMGLAIKDSNGQVKSTDQLLGDIADKFATYRGGINKTALAIDLFGEKIGPKLIPLLNGGKEGLRASADEAERLGLAIGSNLAQSAEKLNDEMSRLNAQWKAFKIGLGEDVIPFLADLVAAFNAARLAGLDFEKTLRSFRGFGGDYDSMLKNEIENLDTLKKKRDALADPEAQRAGALFGAESEESIRKRLAGLDEEIRQQTELTRILARKAAAGQAAEVAFEAIATGSYGGNKDAPGARAKSQATEVDKLVESLQKQLEVTAQLTVYEQTLLALDRAKGPLNDAQRERALSLAKEIDGIKAATEAKKEQAKLDEIIAAAETKHAQAIEADTQRYKDIADPVEKYVRQLERIDELQQAGNLNGREADLNRQRIYQQIAATGGLNDKLKETVDIARQLGLTFESAFEKVLFEGGKVRDLLAAIAIDFAKLFIRQNVTTPLLKFASGLFSPYPSPTPEQIGNFVNPEVLNLVPQTGASAAISQTINVAAGVSMAAVSSAVAQGVQIGQAAILDSRARGGAFA